MQALWYVEKQKTHVWAHKPRGNTDVIFFILGKDNPYGADKLTFRLMEMYSSAVLGKWDR